jgi:glucan 1,3-beta-glucosidase
MAGDIWCVNPIFAYRPPNTLTGAGDKFKDSSNPVPVVKVGKEGETGVAEISELRFTVSEVLPGAILVEVNLSGSPGDVAIWNSMATVGGTKDSQVSTSCSSTDTQNCKAAFMIMHLAPSSSAYIENFWGWTADHDVDGGPTQNIATGRGLLVSSTKATWLVGTGFEHNWLYNYNFHSAQNVYAGMLQSETPYMQGLNAPETVPAPWVADSHFGDPDYSWCNGGDQRCRTALATNVDGGKNIYLYASAAWAFFNGPWHGDYCCQCSNPDACQINMMRVVGNPRGLYWYGINTRKAEIMVLDGVNNPSEAWNPGSWEALVIAYRQFAGGAMQEERETEL